MILTVFYPKILKEMIAKFDRDRDLNVTVINYLNRYMLVSPLVMGFLLLCIWDKYDYWVISTILLVCGLATYKAIILWITYKFILPYSLGVVLEGKILLALQGWNLNPGSPSGLRIVYQFKSLSGKNIKKRFGIILDHDQNGMPSLKDDKIIVYEFLSNKKSYHAPFVPEFFKKTCLSNSRIKSTLTY